METIIEVEKKTTYGSDYIYPVNEQARNACALLSNQKTLTEANIKGLKAMGFKIVQVMQANGKKMEVGEL